MIMRTIGRGATAASALLMIGTLAVIGQPAPAAAATYAPAAAFKGCTVKAATAGVAPITDQASALATSADGKTAYIATTTGKVFPVSLPTGAVGCPLTLGATGAGIAMGTTDARLYVVAGKQVLQIDTAAWKVLRRYSLPAAAGSVLDVAVPTAGTALVATDTAVLKLDLSTGTTSTAIAGARMARLETSGNHRVVAAIGYLPTSPVPDNPRIWPTALWVYDVGTGTSVSRPLYKDYARVGIDAAGARIVVAGNAGALLLDGTARLTGTISDSTNLGSQYKAAAVTPDGHYAWLTPASGAGTITRVDLDRIAGPGGLAYLPGQGAFSGAIGDLALTSGGQLVSPVLNGIAFTSATKLYVAPSAPPPCPAPLNAQGWAKLESPPGPVVISADSSVAWLALPLSNTVVPVDLVRRTVGCGVRIGSMPSSLALTPDGKTLFVANHGGNDVSVVDTARKVEVRRVFVRDVKGDVPLSIVAPTNSGALLTTDTGRFLAVSNTGTVTTKTALPAKTELAQPAGGSRIVTHSFVGSTLSVLDNTGKQVVAPTKLPNDEFAGLVSTDLKAANTFLTLASGPNVQKSLVVDSNLKTRLVGATALNADGVAIAPDGKHGWFTSVDVYSSDQTGVLTTIDFATKKVTTSRRIPDLNHQENGDRGAIAASRNNKYLVVATSTGVAVLPE
jgi:sugar lactone lactonase YvrE